jgi:hybrid cluster-associated redox disulfide protein
MPEKKKTGKKEKQITKDIGIRELVEKHPESIAVLMKHGFHCLGCIAAQFETLEQGAKAHGIDPDKLVKELNEAKKGKKEEK